MDAHRGLLPQKLVAQSNRAVTAERPVRQRIAQAAQCNARRRTAPREKGQYSRVPCGKAQHAAVYGGQHRIRTQQERGAALPRQRVQYLQIGDCVIQPSAQPAIEQKPGAAERQTRADRQHHIGIVLFRRELLHRHNRRNAPQRIKIAHRELWPEPPLRQLCAAAVRRNDKAVPIGRGTRHSAVIPCAENIASRHIVPPVQTVFSASARFRSGFRAIQEGHDLRAGTGTLR